MKRRIVSTLLAGLPLLVWRASASASEGACGNIENLPRRQRSLRDALGFELHTEGELRCETCAFFTATEGGGACGQCSLFNGGPVYADSVCNSWGAE